ncbi:MAG TPA: orotidine 5'-phosphate decarboxylase / HUMPS family protein [Nitrososphaeraceae archaeon]|nr:orotidine 5'-phosphate decarboxylase / HUMPS family protein [Nitrososphaeraceae archaeon]
MMIDDNNSSFSSSSSSPYHSRIITSSKEKKSPIVLALDFYLENFNNNNKDLFKKCKEIISATGSQICAIKINFHLLLSLSNIQILELNYLVHKLNLQVIADIKLNDIGNTNIITVNRLQKLGFDAVIVNPFIGITEMKALVSYAHSINFGIISLVYMSHPTSFEGYGLNVVIPSSTSFYSTMGTSNNNIEKMKLTSNNNNRRDNDDIIAMYQLLYNYASSSGSDGIIIGATKFDIIKEISSKLNDNKIAIYSPGLITQGGSIDDAIKAGTDYFILGRHIINSVSPSETLTSIIEQIRKYKKFQYNDK